VFLYTQKTGTPVTVPIPAPVLAAFNALPRVGRYPFWNGTSALLGASGYWQQGLLWVFRHAGIANGHAHRFRDTFAVELLLAGVDIKDVSVLLGHSTTQITEKHYSPWVSARQSRLEAAVRASFATAPVPGPPPTPEPPA
jgi:integrase